MASQEAMLRLADLERMNDMIRKTLIAVATAVTLTLGLGAATAPAEAKVNITIGIGTPGYYAPNYGYYRPVYRYGHRHWHCHWYKVKRYGHWRTVKSCHSHRHSHRHHR
jgi:hypothetical protein